MARRSNRIYRAELHAVESRTKRTDRQLLEVKEPFDMNDELLSFGRLDIRFNLAMGSAEHIYDTLYCARCQAADQDA